MSILRKKVEFYKGESNCEVIVIAAVGMGRLWASSSRHVFPLWGPFLPTTFFSLPMKVLIPLLLLEVGHWSQKMSLKFEQQNELIFKGTLKFFLSVVHSWLPKPTAGRKPSVLPSTEFLGGCPPSTDQTLMENRGGSHSWLTNPAASRKPLVLPSPEFLGRCAPLYRPNPNGKPWWVLFMTTKACCRQKTFILPSPEFLGGCALYRPNPNGKPHWVQVRALVGFQEAKPKNVLAF